jgi:hypothetical protein
MNCSSLVLGDRRTEEATYQCVRAFSKYPSFRAG